MKYFIASLLIVVGLITPVSCTVKLIHFNQDCAGYLKQAADANTAAIALDRVTKALDYIERNRLTEGYTSVLWTTEDENIGFWYSNLKASQQELTEALGSSQLEQTNVLMKLRETLTEPTDSGVAITCPSGLWKYPNNAMYAVIAWVVNILGLLAFCYLMVILGRY